MKRCKTCISFTYDTQDKGSCNNLKFLYTGQGGKIDIDGFEYWDCESCSAGFRVGINFGCIHWQKRGK